MKLGEGGESGRGEEEGEEEEEEMEEGEAALDIPTGTVLAQTEALEMEKKAAMMRSGKTVEERQEEFKGMLLERGVRNSITPTLIHFSPLLSPPPCRCLHSRHGTRSYPSLCLTLATCCSTPRRGRVVSRSLFARGPRKRERRNAVN